MSIRTDLCTKILSFYTVLLISLFYANNETEKAFFHCCQQSVEKREMILLITDIDGNQIIDAAHVVSAT